MLNLTLPSAPSRLRTAGLMTGVPGRTPATAHAGENSHWHLRLRAITGHHASLRMALVSLRHRGIPKAPLPETSDHNNDTPVAAQRQPCFPLATEADSPQA